jgi:hypothetical protein
VRPAGGRPEITLDVVETGGVGVTSSRGGELRVLIRDAAGGQTVDPGSPVALDAGTPVTLDFAVMTAQPVLILPAEGETTLCGVIA